MTSVQPISDAVATVRKRTRYLLTIPWAIRIALLRTPCPPDLVGYPWMHNLPSSSITIVWRRLKQYVRNEQGNIIGRVNEKGIYGTQVPYFN
jgi:hypothetical protein